MLEKLTQAVSAVVRTMSGKATISEKNIEDAVEQIKLALLEADVNLRVVRRFVNATVEAAKGEKVIRAVDPGQQFVKIIFDKIVSLFGDTKTDVHLKGTDTQSVIMLLGLQGAGKTTVAHKLAARLKNDGRRPLLVAGDVVRPAAIEQLVVLGEKIGVPVYRETDKDVVGIAERAVRFAAREGLDTLIIDTAGRLQIDDEMMAELVRMKARVRPDEVILVADAMTGQNAVDIATTFDAALGVTGAILTKFDSDARGGAALSFKSVTHKPILVIGTGEKTEDFEPFYPERIASRILGMGDIVSLVEKAQHTVSQEEAERLQKKAARNEFTLDDMLAQFQQVKKMGSLQSLMEMMPGLAQQLQGRDVDVDDMKKQEAIILSMTKKERANHLIIGPSRRKRIANGSGTSVADVNRLIKQFEKTKLAMKKISRNKGLQAQMLQQFAGGSFPRGR